MQNPSNLTIEDFSRSLFGNLAGISIAFFVCIWLNNFANKSLNLEIINISILSVIFFGILQIISKCIFRRFYFISDQFFTITIFSLWTLFFILVWKSNNFPLAVTACLSLSSLILINSLMPQEISPFNRIFFLVISLVTAYFSLSIDKEFEFKLIGILTITICIFSVTLRYIVSKQSRRREDSKKRLNILLQSLSSKKKEILHKGLKQSKFLASVSHDLKQPMHTINLNLGSIEKILLKIKMTDSEASSSAESLQKLKYSVNYMNNVLDSLLEASRIEQGVSNVRLNKIKINIFIRKIINQHRRLTSEAKLKLEFVSNLSDNELILTDSRLLERIIRNLLNNAIRYTKKGGIRIRISGERDLIKISIIDTGPGIHPKMREKIFNEFVQLDENLFESQKKGGVGLGLSIVKKLASKIGSYVILRSHLGIGSIFTLVTPKNNNKIFPENKVSTENIMLSEIIPQITTTDAINTTVLLIDEDDDSRDAFELLGPNIGLNVITGISSEKIISKTSELISSPKLLIVDSGNTIESPLTSINKIQNEFNHKIPVLVTTSDSENESILFKTDKDFVLLQKPFSTAQLQRKIQLVFSKKL